MCGCVRGFIPLSHMLCLRQERREKEETWSPGRMGPTGCERGHDPATVAWSDSFGSLFALCLLRLFLSFPFSLSFFFLFYYLSYLTPCQLLFVQSNRPISHYFGFHNIQTYHHRQLALLRSILSWPWLLAIIYIYFSFFPFA